MTTAPDANSLNSFIGKPWIAGARGPDSYDCWGLFLAVQKQFFNRDLPEIPLDALNLKEVLEAFTHHPERQRWQRTNKPSSGDAVLMRQSRYPVHIGVWLDIDGGGILHSMQHAGVVYQTPSALNTHGWQIEGIYQFTEKPTISEQNVNDR